MPLGTSLRRTIAIALAGGAALLTTAPAHAAIDDTLTTADLTALPAEIDNSATAARHGLAHLTTGEPEQAAGSVLGGLGTNPR